MTKTFAAALSAVAMLGATQALAASTYDAVGDFSSTNSTGLWSYGYSIAGGAFTAFSTNTGPCFAGLSCWQEPSLSLYQTPLIAKNLLSGTNAYAGTVVQPVGVLNLHPGQTQGSPVSDIDAILRFTAPTTGKYAFTGFLQALDQSPTGVTIFVNGSPVFISGTANWPLSAGPLTTFGGSTYLTAGQTFDVTVNRAGSIFNDSTGLSLQIAAVPEPATWTVMIGGLGLVGFALRRRRALAAA